MLTVVIPTLDAEDRLPACLSALVPAAVEGLVKDVIIVDAGSSDATAKIADAAGAVFLQSKKGRGAQMAAGAEIAKGDWLLFLHADTVLESDWDSEVRKLFEQMDKGRFRGRDVAAAFRFVLDDFGFWARTLEKLVGWRCFFFRLPYGDQGLLISRAHFDRLGGFPDWPLMEDVHLVRKIGGRNIVFLRSAAVTSPARYVSDGYVRRMLKNAGCMALYYLGISPERIAKLYR